MVSDIVFEQAEIEENRAKQRSHHRFDVASEAYQAFSELRAANAGENYFVPEAALIKNVDNKAEVVDFFTTAAADEGLTTGVVVGSLAGVLGGPIGVILGASMGAWAGSLTDAGRAVDNMSVVAVVADKIFAGETAIAALVCEEEPAFDAAFANYQTTILRFDAADIADDVERLYELQSAISAEVVQEIKADRRAARADRLAERRAKIAEQLEAYGNATYGAFGDVTPL